MKTLAVIPARLASTRLPEKPLVEVGGKPLVVRVLEQVKRCGKVDRILVATDSERIAEIVRKNGGEAVLTPPDLKSGGDRVAFVAAGHPEAEVVLNVQVDDPLVGPDMVDPLIGALSEDPEVRLALLSKRIENEEEIASPNIVKMVFDQKGRALYFSRSPIPYPRNPGAVYYKHIGPYAWRRDFLLEFSRWEQTPLEKVESLEMLRVLEKGFAIRCVETFRDTVEIDTPADVEALEKILAQEGGGNA
jgi:3-deoxy-manno-octulosonate cytidylyltransferase (CMP-KDO synthetase)